MAPRNVRIREGFRLGLGHLGYAAIAFVFLVTWLAILPEERHLEARFGEDYLAYKNRTRRWF